MQYIQAQHSIKAGLLCIEGGLSLICGVAGTISNWTDDEWYLPTGSGSGGTFCPTGRSRFGPGLGLRARVACRIIGEVKHRCGFMERCVRGVWATVRGYSKDSG